MEGNHPGKKKANVKELIDFVFSWSLEDILNDDLYKAQVEKIPESFQSVQHYLQAFVFPLLEETRAELSSSMELISRAPYSELSSVQESKPGSFKYNIMVSSWRNSFYNQGREPYRTLPGDIFIIADAKPATVADLKQAGRSWTLAWVPYVKGNPNSFNPDGNNATSFQFKSAKEIGAIDDMHKSLYAVFLLNITTNNRIWKSLQQHGNINIINEVLCSNSMVEDICSQCCLYNNAIFAERLRFKFSPVLNDSQKLAVVCSLCRMQCNHKSYVELIWGPPGTGKTKTVSMLLSSMLEVNFRILACAPTNVAITELASRVTMLVKEASIKNSKDDALFCSLGDLVLFGNKDRLKFGSNLEDIHLDYRVDRLLECFGQLTGWKHCFNSMIIFFEDCGAQYVFFRVCEGRSEKCKVEKLFVDFAREQFRSVALPLRNCVQILCTHVPKRFILEQFKNMASLMGLLHSFESLLFRHDVVSTELEQCFLFPELPPYFSICTLILSDLRKQCVSVLRALKDSLDQIKFPSVVSKDSIRKFCIQRASLIFCTASSSYTLQSILTKPLDILVIDEAAQLRECESTIVLQLPGIRHAILIGDECQLSATVTSKVSDGAGFRRSLFERLSLMGHKKHLLNEQYRMHPSISCFPNSKFYLNKILDAPNVKKRSNFQQYLLGPMFGPYSFISVSSGREQQDVGRSQKNLVEVAVVVKIVSQLYKACSGFKHKVTVGIISPYAAQVMLIQEKLGWKYDNLDGFSVKVKSVDGFQGGEEDIIIISTVRSNSSGSIGFVSNLQRTNVALTRARHCLWILGNEAALANSGSTWEAVVDDAKVRKCFFDAEDDKHLAKAILDVKEELGQLDDLLCQDSALFKACRWKTFVSDRFGQSLRKLKSLQTKKSVIVSLLKLSTGWRPNEMKGRFTTEGSMPIVRQFEIEGWCIVWTIDVEKDTKYIQVLRVWDILPMENVPLMVKCLGYTFGTYTEEILSYCRAKCFEGDLEIPMTWVYSSELKRYKNPIESEPEWGSSAVVAINVNDIEPSNVEKRLLLVKFYSLSYRLVSHLLSGRDCQQLDFLYQVTDQELELILSPRSTFMVGRASTRKIKILTTKLFQKECQHFVASKGCDDKTSNTIIGVCPKKLDVESIEISEEPILRQMFVTVSPKSCAAVKRHLSNLKSSNHDANFSADSNLVDMHDLDDIRNVVDIPNSFLNVLAKHFPLTITFQKFLLMLDGTIGDSFFGRFDAKENLHAQTRGSCSFALQNFIRRKEVNLDRFSLFYWPHFSSHLTKNLDASTVFTEITFHIKGGLPAGEAPDCQLTMVDYVLFTRAQGATLSRKIKKKIYNIFLDYEKRKMENGEFDLADIVIDLHRRLRNSEFQGGNVDYIYVDEVQCLNLKGIALLKYICKNVHEGFVFSADTAQTVASRTGFRLRDSQSLFYREFVLGLEDCGSHEGTGGQVIPDIIHLGQNVHVHAGVLKIAQSVIDLIFRFFPLSIDILSPETGDTCLSNGEIPVLLEAGKDENAIRTIFGNSGNAKTRSISFGAEQVILVRDDCARREIAAIVGEKSLVLTIMECKGLEFQDVLLYNFFGSSPIRSQWRAIHEYMKEQDMLIPTSPTLSISASQAKNRGLCSELKLLYLAITRSKRRLWISENVEDLSNPIFDYWRKLTVIQFRQVDYSLLKSLPVGSSNEEWSSCGTKLYCEGRTEMAMMCFRRAGDRNREKWAKASSLRAGADFMQNSNPEMAFKVLREAAEIYLSIGRNELAAQCFIELKDYEKAGTIYLKKFGQARLEDAGDFFLLAGCHKRAAEAYAHGNYFAKCLAICSSRELHDLGLSFIGSWRQQAAPDVGVTKKSGDTQNIKHNFLQRCALHYHELEDHKSMLKFVKSFHSMDSARAFLKSLNCFDELMELEKKSGNFLEAAAIAKLKGDALMQVDFLERAGHYKDASLLILYYVLSNSLWASGNKGWPLKPFKRKEKLLTKAKLLAVKESNAFYKFVSTEATILSDQTSIFSEMKRNLSKSERQQNRRGIIILARKILDAHVRSGFSSYEWVNHPVKDLMMFSEERVSSNCISIETLIYFWRFWTDKVLDIIDYLGCVETQGVNRNMMIEEFCLHYFGVWKMINNDDTRYFVFSDAEWAVRVDDKQFHREGNLISMNAHCFFSSIKSYWCSEVVSVGVKVLGTFKALHAFSVQTKLPKLCQSKTALHIFEVVNFLGECKFLELCIDYDMTQKLLNMGLEAIIFMNNDALDLRDIDMQQKVARRIHDFLEKCARHCYTIGDKRSMMKFVRAFQFLDSMRSFLKSLDCFDEQLLLEEESGNPLEAANVARRKGDLPLEIDLLAKAGHYKDAVILILSHVLANSLWASGSNGWPLKPFQQKEDLLTKAKALAYNESGVFFEFVCAELDILVDRENSLAELKEHFNASRKSNNITGEILSARKILDAHLSSETSMYEWGDDMIVDLENHSEERISKCQVSIETLIYFWNFWKEKLLNVFEYLKHLETEDSTGYIDYERFCLSFLGVRKQFDEKNRGSLLLNSGAYWIKVTDDGPRKLVNLDAQFVTSAHSFWSSEVYSVGLKVLESLRSLHMFSLRNSFSLFRQCKVVIHVFEVANFLSDSNFLKRSPNDKVLSSFLKLSTQSFFENVFPLEWRSPTENMMTLRRTKLPDDLLEEIILENVSSESKLTYGRIGSVLMIMFGSGKLSATLREMVEKRFDVNPRWKAVIHEFKDHVKGSGFADGLTSGKLHASSRKVALISKLHDALSATINIDWRNELDYVSPNCLLYLVERFLLLVSFNEKCFFTTKSSLVEWFISQELDACPSTKSSLTGAFDFVACTVNQLLAKKTDTMEWIKRSNIDLSYYPLMLFRLVVLICLLCLNSGKYFDVLQNLVGRIDISSHLPLEFLKALQGRRKRKCELLNVLGDALAKIGNPLVIVSSEDDGQKMSCHAIFMHRRQIQSEEEFSSVLFSKNDNNNRDNVCAITSKTLKSRTVGLSSSTSGKKWVEAGTNINTSRASYAPKVHMENRFHSTTASVFSSCKSPIDSSDGNSLGDELMQPIESELRDWEIGVHATPACENLDGLQIGRATVEPSLSGQQMQIDAALEESHSSVASGFQMKKAKEKAKEDGNSTLDNKKASGSKSLVCEISDGLQMGRPKVEEASLSGLQVQIDRKIVLQESDSGSSGSGSGTKKENVNSEKYVKKTSVDKRRVMWKAKQKQTT